MQKKTSGISPYLLVLMQIGLILTLLVWWGLLGKFLLPAVIQGQADCLCRGGEVRPADGGLAALLCGGLVGAHPVLPVRAKHKKSRGLSAFGFFDAVQRGCLPREASTRRLSESSPGSKGCSASAMSQR